MENKGTHWNDRQDDYISLNWSRLSDEEMAEALGRSPYAIRRRRHMLGLHREGGSPSGVRKFSPWSEGAAILTAEEFVEGMAGMDTNDKLMRIDHRIAEVAACIARLFECAPVYRTWGDSDTRSLVKLQGIAKGLKKVRALTHAEGSRVDEAIINSLSEVA